MEAVQERGHCQDGDPAPERLIDDRAERNAKESNRRAHGETPARGNDRGGKVGFGDYGHFSA